MKNEFKTNTKPKTNMQTQSETGESDEKKWLSVQWPQGHPILEADKMEWAQNNDLRRTKPFV